METKKIADSLRCCVSSESCKSCGFLDNQQCRITMKIIAANRLEELESEKENLVHHNADLNHRLNKAESHIEMLGKQKEAMLKELCDKEDLVREAEGRFYELEKELDTLKNATKKQPETEWISVEERLPEKEEFVLVSIGDK